MKSLKEYEVAFLEPKNLCEDQKKSVCDYLYVELNLQQLEEILFSRCGFTTKTF
jgi:hypothetical protein